MKEYVVKGMTCAACVRAVEKAASKVEGVSGPVVSLATEKLTFELSGGFDEEKLDFVKELKNRRRGRIKEYADKYGAEYHGDLRPWDIPCDCAFPSATQNEISGADAAALVQNGCQLVSEGANMPSTPEAVDVFIESHVLYGPGKAANAGGVATSGLEMAQNSMHINWTRAEVEARLHQIMIAIHHSAFDTASEYGQPGNYMMGANISGFIRVAKAMLDQGLV